MAEYSIGVDLGGTNLRAAAISSTGQILEKVSGETKLSAGRDAVVADMVASIVKLRDKCGSSGLAGVGIGTPGFIIMEKGIITASPNLPGFENFPMRDDIERQLRAPVILENDANAAALGEKWQGAGRDVDDLVLLTLGTGIGGGVIVGGRALHGYLGMAGELGHITVNPMGNPCGCGNRGCLEKHASATAVSALARVLNVGENLTAKQICALATSGDERALRVWSLMGEALGVALAMLVNIFNAPLYLLSGGMLPAWEFFAPTMMDVIRQRSFTFRASETRIEKATLGNEAGLYGAAYLPWLEA